MTMTNLSSSLKHQKNGVTITESHNGQSGAGQISALAISDCVDGTKDLVDCPTETCNS